MALPFCAVALALLVDISGSVSMERVELQRKGIAQALREPEVTRLFTPENPVAISLIEFNYEALPRFRWEVLTSAAAAAALADRIEALAPTEGWGSTGIADVITAAIDSYAELPCEPERKVVDISGDGEESSDGDPEATRSRAQAEGVEINALPILVPEHEEKRAKRLHPSLDRYYQDSVITPGNWVIPAAGYEDIGRAMSRKLKFEIAGSIPDEG